MERTRVWAERWNRATLPPPPPRGLKKVEVYSSPTLSPEVGNSELRGQVCHPQQALLPLLAPRLRLFLSLCWWEDGAKKAGSGSWTLHLRSCPELGQGHPWLAAGEAGRCWEMCKNVQQIYSYGGWSKWGWDPPPPPADSYSFKKGQSEPMGARSTPSACELRGTSWGSTPLF